MNESPRAGWYADPRQPMQRRWWDGATWTDHVQSRPKPQNGMAVASLTCGIVGCAFIFVAVLAYPIPLALGITAFVLGIIARKRSSDPAVGHRTMATWGIALGVVSFLIGVVGAVAIDNTVNDVNRELNKSQ